MIYNLVAPFGEQFILFNLLRYTTFRAGAADFMVSVHWVYKAHVLLGMTLFLIAPFTRLVHVWSIPLSYLWRPYQVVRKRPATLDYGRRSRA